MLTGAVAPFDKLRAGPFGCGSLPLHGIITNHSISLRDIDLLIVSSYKRSSKLKLFLLIAVVSVSSIYLFLYFLPQLTEILIPLYLKTQGIKDFQIKVDKVTSHEISVHSVKLGKEEEITLSRAKISYSLKEVFEGKVDNIDINGLSLDLRLKNGRLSSDFLQSLPQAQEGAEKKRRLPLILPFKKMAIRNSKIIFSTPEEKIVVLLNAGIDNLGKDNIMETNINLSLKSNRGNATAKISFGGSPEKFEGNFELAAEGEINIPKTVRIPHGNINLKGNVSFQNHLLSLRMNEAKVRTDYAIEISDFNTKIEPFQLFLKRDTESKFLIDFSNSNKWAFIYDLQLEPTTFKINVKDKNIKRQVVATRRACPELVEGSYRSGEQIENFSQKEKILQSNIVKRPGLQPKGLPSGELTEKTYSKNKFLQGNKYKKSFVNF